MHRVYLSLGSNIDPEHHLCRGIAELERRFGGVRCSGVYRSEAVGFDGPAFLNLVAVIQTSLSLAELADELRELEYDYGRPDNASKFSSRHLDIDILTYDNLCGVFNGLRLPRADILTQSYVLFPFSELAPDFILPGHGESMKHLAVSLRDVGPPLQPVVLESQLERVI